MELHLGFIKACAKPLGDDGDVSTMCPRVDQRLRGTGRYFEGRKEVCTNYGVKCFINMCLILNLEQTANLTSAARVVNSVKF